MLQSNTNKVMMARRTLFSGSLNLANDQPNSKLCDEIDKRAQKKKKIFCGCYCRSKLSDFLKYSVKSLEGMLRASP